jgi:hypothetical protein
MRGEWTPATSRTVDLGYEQLLVLESRPGVRVRVLYGNLWLTEEGRAQDVFAGSGTEIALESNGRAVVEGLGLARVQVIEPAGRASLARLASAFSLRWLIERMQGLRLAALRMLHA